MFLSAGNTGANSGASELPERKNLTDGGGGEERARNRSKELSAFKEMCSKIPHQPLSPRNMKDFFFFSSKNTSFLQRCQTKWLGG